MVKIEPGQIANFDTSDRLCIPMDLMRVVEWWADKSSEVVAELVQLGLVRIYHPDEALPAIDELRSSFANLPAAERFERAIVVADRYRTLKLYSDARLRFTKDVADFLEFKLGGSPPPLFVQPFPKGLELLTLAFRAERLARTAPLTTVRLRLIGMD